MAVRTPSSTCLTYLPSRLLFVASLVVLVLLPASCFRSRMLNPPKKCPPSNPSCNASTGKHDAAPEAAGDGRRDGASDLRFDGAGDSSADGAREGGRDVGDSGLADFPSDSVRDGVNDGTTDGARDGTS